MNLKGKEQVDVITLNVVSLFERSEAPIIMNDPLENLIQESVIQDEVLEPKTVRARKVVNENQFPDQSMYVLEEQLSNLRKNLDRLKFYLGELDDILPH